MAPITKLKSRTTNIAESRVPPTVAVKLFNSRAVSVSGYVAQLSPPPAALNAAELWCGSKILRLPDRAVSVSAAFSVQLVGLQIW